MIAYAAPASAGPVYSFEYNVAYDPILDPPGGKCVTSATLNNGCYIATGDYIEVQDNREDGYETGVQWTTDYGRFGLCINLLGGRSYGFCNKDFAEGHTITFRLGHCDKETSVDACRSRGWIWDTGYRTVST